jgi:hypothetical protein
VPDEETGTLSQCGDRIQEAAMTRLLTVNAYLAAGGLFVARLNNGDWMTGKSSYIYHLDIKRDHYADPNLVIRNTMADAVSQARRGFQEKPDE